MLTIHIEAETSDELRAKVEQALGINSDPGPTKAPVSAVAPTPEPVASAPEPSAVPPASPAAPASADEPIWTPPAS